MDTTTTHPTTVNVTNPSSTTPSSTTNPPNASSTVTTRSSSPLDSTEDLVIDYDEAQDETLRFMAELPRGPLRREHTMSPMIVPSPLPTPSPAPAIPPVTEQEVEQILSEAQATSSLPGPTGSAPSSSSPSNRNPLSNMSIPRGDRETQRQQTRAVLSAMNSAASTTIEDVEMQEVSFTPVQPAPAGPSNDQRNPPQQPAPPQQQVPQQSASQARRGRQSPEIEVLSFKRYPNRKIRSSAHQQATHPSPATFLDAMLTATLTRLSNDPQGAETLVAAMNGTMAPPRSTRGTRGGQNRQGQAKGKGKAPRMD